MVVKVTPPGLNVPVEVPDDQVQTYLSQGWSQVEPESPKPKPRRTRKGSGGDEK